MGGKEKPWRRGWGDLTEGFFALPVWWLLFGGVYTWRGLFSEFHGNLCIRPS